jgi:hypothetical protein
MNKSLTTFCALVFLSILIVVPIQPTVAATVFSDNFSSGNFDRWSQSYAVSGATQSIRDGIARFIVPTPTAGSNACSYLVRDGFTSTVNSTIIASQNILVTKVPNGVSQGNGAIFFLYVCDSTDLGGNAGNIGIGIDGSRVWSMWLGGSLVYTYVFQTQGPKPTSNTWYHIVLTINNQAQTAVLEVNGIAVISTSQQEFTDTNHPLSLMSGMGENWWSDGSGQQEIAIDNVQLDISDVSSTSMSSSTSNPNHSSSSPNNPLTDPSDITANSSFLPPLIPPTQTLMPHDTGMLFGLTIMCVTLLTILIVVLLAVFRHKR